MQVAFTLVSIAFVPPPHCKLSRRALYPEAEARKMAEPEDQVLRMQSDKVSQPNPEPLEDPATGTRNSGLYDSFGLMV